MMMTMCVSIYLIGMHHITMYQFVYHIRVLDIFELNWSLTSHQYDAANERQITKHHLCHLEFSLLLVIFKLYTWYITILYMFSSLELFA